MRTKNNLVQWLKFFLVGVMETAQNSIETFNAIIKLRQEVEEKKIIQMGKRAPLAKELLNFYTALVDTNEVAEVLKVNIATSHRPLNSLLRGI